MVHFAKPSGHSRRLILSYAPDWIVTLLLAAAFLSLDKVEGYRRLFSLSDPRIRYPFAEHVRVPNVPLYVISLGAPFVIMAVTNLFTVRTWWDLHHSSLGLALAFSLTGSLTQIVKVTVGRPRPDLIDRCQPPAGLTDPPFGLTSWEVCTQTSNKVMRDGFRSFFSGHSSSSFAGLGFLSFYLAGKMHLFDSRGHAGKAWLSLAPLMGALLVAISRTMDSRHHWEDVVVGSVVGLLFAFFSYRQYYPPLESPVAHQPYGPRIHREEAHDGYTITGHQNGGGIIPLHTRTQSGGTKQRFDADRFVNTAPGFGAQAERYRDDDHDDLLTGALGPPGTVPRNGGPSLDNLYEQERRHLPRTAPS